VPSSISFVTIIWRKREHYLCSTTKYSNSPFHERLRFYHRWRFGLSSASLFPILSVKRDGNG
jgi:hypothetical protein